MKKWVNAEVVELDIKETKCSGNTDSQSGKCGFPKNCTPWPWTGKPSKPSKPYTFNYGHQHDRIR